MPYNRESVICKFCQKITDEKGVIQFDDNGEVIGCCESCFEIAKLFVNNGKAVKPTKKEE